MAFIVKNTTLPNIFDLLAPHSCRGCGRIGKALCDYCKNDIISNHTNFCPNCKTNNLSGNCQKCKSLPAIFVVGHRVNLIGKLIHDFKYNSVRALAKPLAEIIHHTLPPVKEPVYIVPLPTISSHIRKRGLDHTYLISKHFAKIRHIKIQKLLIRDQDTVQVGSDRKTRLTQATHAYSISPKIKVNPNVTYILLDDVWTTGASIKAAIKKLRKAGAKKIIVAILAVS